MKIETGVIRLLEKPIKIRGDLCLFIRTEKSLLKHVIIENRANGFVLFCLGFFT
jgi:hypothetical protein